MKKRKLECGELAQRAHKVILLSISPFLQTMQKTLDSDFSGQNTPSVISLLKLQMLSRETHEVEQIVRENPFWSLQMKYMMITRILLKTMFIHSWRHYENCERN